MNLKHLFGEQQPLYVLSCLIFKLMKVTAGKKRKSVVSAEGLLQGPLQRSCYLEIHAKHETATQKKRPLPICRMGSSNSNW